MDPWSCCRTCLSDVFLNSIVLNPELKDRSLQYCEVILAITGIKIRINDCLPQALCTTCTDTLDKVISFRNTCQLSHTTLMGRLHQQGSSNIKNEQEKVFNHRKSSDNTINKLNSDDLDQNNDHCDSQSYNVDDNTLHDMVEFESTVEEILKKQMTFTIDNYKPTKRVRKIQLKDGRTEAPKIAGHKQNSKATTLEISKLIPHQVDIDTSSQQEDKVPENKVESDCNKYQCEYCFKMYDNKVSYVNHTKIHTGLKVICEHCGKEFLDKRRLLMHCRSKHGYQKTDKCTYCDYLGISPESVKIHERIHTGEKPYKCKECPASFHRSSSYLQHTARHLPDKTVQCQQCPALFKSVTLMRIHANRHKPRDHKFKCLVCGGNFSSRSSVGRHLRRAHAVARCTQAHLQRVKLNEP